MAEFVSDLASGGGLGVGVVIKSLGFVCFELQMADFDAETDESWREGWM